MFARRNVWRRKVSPWRSKGGKVTGRAVEGLFARDVVINDRCGPVVLPVGVASMPQAAYRDLATDKPVVDIWGLTGVLV
jgi:hypothetical protein